MLWMSCGIDGRDEGLVEAREDLVDHFVAAVLQNVDFRGGAGQREFPVRTPSRSSRVASEMISTCFRKSP